MTVGEAKKILIEATESDAVMREARKVWDTWYNADIDAKRLIAEAKGKVQVYDMLKVMMPAEGHGNYNPEAYATLETAAELAKYLTGSTENVVGFKDWLGFTMYCVNVGNGNALNAAQTIRILTMYPKAVADQMIAGMMPKDWKPPIEVSVFTPKVNV